jgi:hypothetical protein
MTMSKLTNFVFGLSFCTAIACTPALAQGVGLDASDSQGGIQGVTNAPSTLQGFNVAKYSSNGTGSVSIKRDALPQATWFKSRRQVTIEDDSPIVSHSGGGGGSGLGNGLSQAGFGSNLGGAPTYNMALKPANFGGLSRPDLTPVHSTIHGPMAAPPMQARPMAISQTLPQAPVRQMAPAASYGGGYGGAAKPVATTMDYQTAHTRDVKARLLGH